MMIGKNLRRVIPATVFIPLCLFIISCGNEPANDIDTKTSASDSIAQVEKISLGGLDQAVMINSADSTLPILLILHGGPGFPEWVYFRTYNSELEKHFVVVNWDQRGAGLSYSPGIPDSSINMPRFISDAHELVAYLKKRFHKEKIFLLGHSWGSALGVQLVQQYPGDFLAYVGVGQVVNMKENERQSYRFTLQKAKEEKNDSAITALKAIERSYAPNAPMNLDALYTQRGWLSYYGGAIYGEKNYDKINRNLSPKEKKLYADSTSAKGEALSMKLLWPELLRIDFIKTAPALDVPVYFFVGRHDYNTPFALAEQYFNVLKAPRKELIWFEHSAHMMPFEEPGKFNEVMINKVLKER